MLIIAMIVCWRRSSDDSGEELMALQVPINEEKSRTVDLAHGETLSFLGFHFRRVKSQKGSGVRGTRRCGRSGRRFCAS